jgi:putative redox protein
MKSDWTAVAAEWRGDLSFQGSNEAGGSVEMGSLEGKTGIWPMEMLLLGLAGCTGVDVVNILRKQRQPLQGLRVEVRARRAENHPKVYTEIEITYLIQGEGLSLPAIERAIELSEKKYCSASAMLGKSAEISSSYRVI